MKDYYIMCNMTWAVLSSFHYIFEEGVDAKAATREQPWSKERETLANWLMSEANNLVETKIVSSELANKLDKLLEQRGDEITFYASQKIKESTYNSEERFSVDEIKLYLYMCWLMQVVNEFSNFAESKVSQLGSSFNSGTLSKLQQLLKQETTKMEKSSEKMSNYSRQIAKDLVNFWKTQVESIT